MQALSSSALAILRAGGTVGVNILVEGVGDTIILNEGDLVENSLTIDRNSVSGDQIEIGNAETTELIFDLDNSDGRYSAFVFEGARLTVDLVLGVDTLRVGIFTVDQPPRKLGVLHIIALDNMARFNRPYGGSLAYPATLAQILQDVCTQCGITLATTSFLNSAYSVTERPVDITCHEIVAAVTELAGCCAWMDHLGQLRISWYSDTGAELGLNDMLGSYDMAESDISITGIRYEDQDYQAGTADYSLVIEGNPLLQSGWQSVVDAIYSAIGGFTYRPWSADCKGYPHLWPLDIVNPLTDSEGVSRIGIITNHKYTLGGFSTLRGTGETETVKGYATAAPFTARQKTVIQKTAELETSAQLTPIQQMALKLNSLAAGAMALNSTEYNAIIYWHDASTLAGSSYIAAFTDAGFMWTDAWNGGSPVWNYGFTSDGDALFRYLSVKGLHADWITSGTMSAERIDVDSLVVKKIANVTTSPTSWVTMGELTLGSVLYRGIFLYSTLYSSTDPAFMITASGSDGDFTLWDRNDVPRMSVGSGADDGWAYWDKFGVSRFSIGNWGGAYFWSAFGVGETLHTGTLLPVEPSVSDIGSSNYKWKDGFFSGEIYARYLELAAHDSTNEGGELKLLGAGIYEDIIIDTFKGTFRVHNGSIPYLVVTGSNIRPEINNAHDLGSSTQAWKDAYLSGTIYSNVPTNELKNIIYGQMATNDFYRIRAGGLSDSGYLEIATADGGNEPIYIRQYTGTFTTIARSLTLLDASGNSVFPGTVYVSGGQPVWHAGNMIYATGALTYGSWYTSPNPAVIETIQWTRIGGMVFLGGAFYRGNANEAVLTILPAEVRPPKKIVFGASPIEPYSDRAVIEVNTDGTVACTFYNLSSGNYATKSFSLNGICYRL